jgi:glycosyltransferase involved in cell wall biosynthesis
MIRVVVWDPVRNKAWTIEENSRVWDAPELSIFIAGLQSAYLCVASADLLQQDATYLETNLIVLESEQLFFTVNLRGYQSWSIECLERGFLPGNKQNPLLRLVVRKEIISDGFSLNLIKPQKELGQSAAYVGKLLIQTTNYPDQKKSLPFEVKVPKVALKLHGRRYLISRTLDESWQDVEIQHRLHPVDSILPILQEPDERPTMILVQSFLAVGGAERVHLDLMNYLKDDIRFVVLTGEVMDLSLGTTAEAHRAITPYVYNAYDYLEWKLNFSHLIFLIERFQPDTLYMANGVNWLYDILPELRRRYPHLRIGNQVYDSIEGWINRYNETIAVCFDANICSNKKIGRAYIGHGVELEKIFLISNGVAVDEFDRARYSTEEIQIIKSKLGIPTGKRVVTYISRIHHQKRPMDFVEMARRFIQDPSVVFLMIGDGPLSETVNAEISRTGIKNIIRHSFTPSSDVFAVSDVMVLPSEYEGMPMIILEAQAMGVPIVVTDVGNNREVLEITSGGVLVSTIGDISALANGVKAMLETPPDPNELRQSIIDQFSLSQMGENYRKALIHNTRKGD